MFFFEHPGPIFSFALSEALNEQGTEVLEVTDDSDGSRFQKMGWSIEWTGASSHQTS